MKHDPQTQAEAARLARSRTLPLIDRAVAWFSPQTALKRAQARHQLTAWGGGGVIGPRRDRWVHDTWRPRTATADDIINPDLSDIHALVSDLVVSSPIAQAAMQVAGTHIVGPGLEMRPAIDRALLGLEDEDAELAEADIKRRWRLWANSPDASIGRDGTFASMTRLVLESMKEKGDVLALLTAHRGRPVASRAHAMAVQLIEAERLSNPGMVQDGDFEGGSISAGVQRGASGAVTAYQIADQHPGDMLRAGSRTWTAVPAFGPSSGRRNVLHVFRQRRVAQSRGLSDLAVVIETVKQATNYVESEVAAAVKASYYALFIETEWEGATAANADAARSNADKKGPEKLQAGIFDMNPGEKITSPVPGRPNDSAAAFLALLLQLIGSALRIPHEILASKFDSSFSASQAALNVFWASVEDDRALLVRQWCDPVYAAWMDLEVALGLIDAPGYQADPLIRQAWLGARWTGRPKPIIREDLAAKSAGLRIDTGLSSRSEEVSALSGRDADAVHAELAREKRERIDDGLDAEQAPAGEAEPGDIFDAEQAPAGEAEPGDIYWTSLTNIATK